LSYEDDGEHLESALSCDCEHCEGVLLGDCEHCEGTLSRERECCEGALLQDCEHQLRDGVDRADALIASEDGRW
jgi:hypothetical protein